MANAITLRTEMLPDTLDLIYKQESKTAVLEQPNPFIRAGANAKTVQIAKRELQGYGDYGRQNGASGFPSGDVSLTWDTYTMQFDRGQSFTVDVLDNDESGMNAFGSMESMASQFEREYSVPEVDAIRFAQMTDGAGTVATGAVLTASTVVPAIDLAIQTQDDAEVTGEKVLYVSNSVYNFMKGSDKFTYNLNSNGADANIDTRIAMYDGIPVIKVPQSRFYTAITLSATDGYAKDAGGFDINFMLVTLNAVAPVKGRAKARYYDPDTNQSGDSHLLQIRLYHDLFVFANKADGIYVHPSTS